MRFCELQIGDKFILRGELFTKVRPGLKYTQRGVCYFNCESQSEYTEIPDDSQVELSRNVGVLVNSESNIPAA